MDMNNFSLRRKIIVVLFVGIAVIAGGIIFAEAAQKSVKNSSVAYQTVVLTNEDYFPVLLEAIDKAQKEIMISMFSFKTGLRKNTYPDIILSHLADAVKRGVKVIVILERTGRKSDELDIQNRQTGRLLTEKGVNVFFDSPRKTTHTKLVVIDQRLLIMGSHNFTQSALKYNNEISILLESPDMAKNVRDYMLKIIKEAK
jgi:phosphatidylserine/phosphatidylglycerophosphate/cardiolipin synthase-like enzyme